MARPNCAQSPCSRGFSAVLLIGVTLLLHACAAPRGKPLPELGDWETRRQFLEATDRFEFRGRIGVSAGEEGFNGKLAWRQTGEKLDASVGGPLGMGTVVIAGTEQRLTLTDKDGQVTELFDVESDLKIRYGWTLPVTSLRYWALGIPDPATTSVLEFGDDGLPSVISQRGWTVRINEYREGGGQSMPRRISAVGAEARVRLVVDHWAFY